MNPLTTCIVCGNPEVVVLNPLPLCQYHNCPPEISGAIQDTDEIVEESDEDNYNQYPYDDFPIPVYPI